jgi:hypothetical protein
LLPAVAASDLSENSFLSGRDVNRCCGASWHDGGCILSAIRAMFKDASYSNHFSRQIKMSANLRNDALGG